MLKVSEDIWFSKMKLEDFMQVNMILNVSGADDIFSAVDKAKGVDIPKIVGEFLASTQYKYKSHTVKNVENCLNIAKPRVIFKIVAELAA